MQKGDKVEFHIGGHVAGHATVSYLGEGRCELIVPATKVVMGVKTSLTDLEPAQSSTQVIIDGVERVDTPVVESTPEETPSAAVVEQPPVDTTAQVGGEEQ